jgi:NADPH:quinone reductase-like Zn-dependent oxidoreductase
MHGDLDVIYALPIPIEFVAVLQPRFMSLHPLLITSTAIRPVYHRLTLQATHFRMTTMKAVVLYAPGPPSALKIEQRPIPKAAPGQVLIRVHAFGLNRSELFTRLGQSPNVRLPRILGIEAVGVVSECPGEEYQVGETVATCMGGLGREVDGGYAEYTLVKAEFARAIETDLPWDVLGALPEMLQTSWGALNAERGLQIGTGETLLVRGGTTSVGLAAAAIAKSQGLTVLATTRRQDRTELLKAHGVDHVIVDDGHIEAKVKQICPGGVDKVLELVGATLLDSCRCVKEGGRVRQVGVVGGNTNADLEDVLPKGATYGFYGGEQEDFHAMPLQEMVDQVAEGKLVVQIGKKFSIGEIVEAHRTMEENTAGGKIVVLT